jgi:hypothetical protein
LIYVVLGNVALSATSTILSLAIHFAIGVDDARGRLESDCAATERNQLNREALEAEANKKDPKASITHSLLQNKQCNINRITKSENSLNRPPSQSSQIESEPSLFTLSTLPTPSASTTENSYSSHRTMLREQQVHGKAALVSPSVIHLNL